MKTSLALALIMSTVVGQSAFASGSDVPPPLPSIQIIPSSSARAVVTPEAQVGPTAQTATPTVASPSAAAVPAQAAPLAPIQILPPSVATSRPAAVRPSTSRPPVARTAAVRATPVRSAAVRPAAASQKDEASRVFDSCVAQENQTKRSAVRCITRATARAESAIESNETRLLNCRELRKATEAAEPALIDSLVNGRMFQLRAGDDNSFKSMIASAGKIGPRKTAEIELRATLKHLDNVSKLASQVCDVNEFAKILSK